MTHSIHSLIVFEERAANQMENGLKLLSLCGKLEGTGSFPEGLTEVYFIGFARLCDFRIFLEVFRKLHQK